MMSVLEGNADHAHFFRMASYPIFGQNVFERNGRSSVAATRHDGFNYYAIVSDRSQASRAIALSANACRRMTWI
jgi:hypothetical protein